MRTIIAGSRSISDMNILNKAIANCGWKPTVVISGTAPGADSLGECWAQINSVPVEQYPANWALYGKKAGYIRNIEMSNNADSLIALWDGISKGTKHMIDIAKRKGLLVHIEINIGVADE